MGSSALVALNRDLQDKAQFKPRRWKSPQFQGIHLGTGSEKAHGGGEGAVKGIWAVRVIPSFFPGFG